MNKRASLLAGFLILQVIITGSLGTSVAYGLGNNKAPKGLIVWGNNLSGLNEDEALAELEKQIPDTVFFGNQSYSLDISQSKIYLKNWLQNQYPPVTGSPVNDALKLITFKSPVNTEPTLLLKDEIMPQLEAIKKSLDQRSFPAGIKLEKDKLVRTPGQIGLELDIDKTWNNLIQSRGHSTVPLSVQVTNSHPSTLEVDDIQDKLGDYTTYFNPKDVERTNNVRLASAALDGQIIPPGGEFSFNQTVGKRDESAGYLPAYVFANKTVVKDDGGGVCQDSTTLYQAVRQSNLLIKEKHTHSLPVSYIPKGQDATVAYGLLDFRFVNNTESNILISAVTGTNYIRVRLYGKQDSEHPAIIKPAGYPYVFDDWVDEQK